MGVISNPYIIDQYIKEFAKDLNSVIDNLLSHHLIEESEKDDYRKELARATIQNQIGELFSDQFSEMMGVEKKQPGIPILEALLYIECVRHVGKNEINSVLAYRHQRSNKPDRKLNDSVRKELYSYLEQINTAGLISSLNNTQCSIDIKNDKIKDRFDILFRLCSTANLSQIPGYDLIVVDKQKKSITEAEIKKAVSEWKKVGILQDLTDKQLRSAVKRCLDVYVEDLNDVLLYFPGVAHNLDLEIGNLNDPYGELLRELAVISNGEFDPNNISDNFSKPVNDKVTVKFDLNGKTYSKDLKVYDDWMDTDVFDFIRNAVTENKLTRQLYSLQENGQGATFIFLDPQQYEYLKTNNLLIFNDF